MTTSHGIERNAWNLFHYYVGFLQVLGPVFVEGSLVKYVQGRDHRVIGLRLEPPFLWNHPRAGKTFGLDNALGWTLWKKITCFKLETVWDWQQPWAGNSLALETALVWKQPWSGNSLVLETALGRKQPSAGKSFRLATAAFEIFWNV